eukprot:704683_1
MERNLESLTKFVKDAARKVFGNAQIGDIIYNTIHHIITTTNTDYEDVDDFDEDLKAGVESWIVSSVTTQLEQSHCRWSANDSNELFNMLYKIYHDKVTDISQFHSTKRLRHKSRFSSNYTSDPFQRNIISIVIELNQNTKKKIDINSVKQLLFARTDWNADTIMNITASLFCEEAKKYGIKRPLANKLLRQIQSGYKRDLWTIESKVKVYSKSKQSWYPGVITHITKDEEGEWLSVKYNANGQHKTKQIQRNCHDIQPISIVSVFSASPTPSVRGDIIEMIYSEDELDDDDDDDDNPKFSLAKPNITPISVRYLETESNGNTMQLDAVRQSVPVDEVDYFEPTNPLYVPQSVRVKHGHTRSLSRFPSVQSIGQGRSLSKATSVVTHDVMSIQEDEEVGPINRTSLAQLTPLLDDRKKRDKWEMDDVVEMYIAKADKWITARIIDIDADDMLELQPDDGPFENVKIHRMSEHVMPTNECTFSKPELLRISTNTTPLAVAHDNRVPLLEKVSEAIDSINHQIDSSHDFLYQVYHTDHGDQKHTFITYEHHEAMAHYRNTIEQKYSTSMLCNGKIIKEYGESESYTESTKDAQKDYRIIHHTLYSAKLDKSLIVMNWKMQYQSYPQKWLLSVKKEDFVDVAVNVFQMDNVQNAMKLYKKLIRLVNYEDTIQEAEAKVDGQDDMLCDDIMFLWTRKDVEDASIAPKTHTAHRTGKHTVHRSIGYTQSYDQALLLSPPSESKEDNNNNIMSLDHIHFLYVVSRVLDTLKLKAEFNQVDRKAMLLCLHRVRMNGLVFSKITKHVFIGSVIIYSHSFQQVDMKSLIQLKNCTEQLYDQIKAFDLESITPSSICNISLSQKPSQRGHDQDEKSDKNPEDHEHHEHDVLDTFQQWMITFDAQYNRSTPFSLGMFKALTDLYEMDRNVIINMKYDNYSTDLCDKTYDHVLKSFIAWSITLKCGTLRCQEKLKLNCYCDTNTFQLFTYRVIMGLIELKANNKYELLKNLRDINSKTSVSALCDAFCAATLPNQLLKKRDHDHEYIKAYKVFVIEWINFEFYNFKCIYCHHINKTIMIDRVYQYSRTMDSCRICNKKQMARVRTDQPQFDIKQAVDKKNKREELQDICERIEFTLDSLSQDFSRQNVDSRAFSAFIRDEQYDSESVKEDVESESKDSNIYTVSPECYELIKQILKGDRNRSSTFHEGMIARYLVLRPKYLSLLNEICLHVICPLECTDWELKIWPAVSHEYEKNLNAATPIVSSVSDNRFGIEIGEPIGIHHLAAIFLFTDDRFADYRSAFTQSYWKWDENTHCNNFYWTGRYLYEVVQFYGTKMNKFNQITKREKAKLYLGIGAVKSFDSVAPVFNLPMLLTDSDDVARRFAGTHGCVLLLRPKYIGDIDSSKILYRCLFNRQIRLVMGTKLQLKGIKTMKSALDFEPVVLAIQYIEKILLQTKFDVHFYESKGLYKLPNMKHAYNLILQSIENKTHDKTNVNKEDDDGLQYGQDLFRNWCLKRHFVTFETFRLEMHYMDIKLQEFLYDKARKKINIANVKAFLPNLTHYHDINGDLRIVAAAIHDKTPNTNKNKKASHDVFGLLYNCQSHDIPYHIVNALQDIGYKFSDDRAVLKEAFRLELRKLRINHDSFYKKKNDFEKQLSSIGISTEVATDCIESIVKEHHIHSQVTAQHLIKWILNRLEVWFNKDGEMKPLRCGSFALKKAFQRLYNEELIQFTHQLRKEKVTIRDLHGVARRMKIFDEETAKKLSKYLYIKMMDDKQKIVPWECKTCQFLNSTIMVNGLWRHYNEGNECGMCGDPRYVPTNKVKKSETGQDTNVNYHRRSNSMLWQKISHTLTTFASQKQEPAIDTKEWSQIGDNAECTLFQSTEHSKSNQFSLRNFSYLLKHHFFPDFYNCAKQKQSETLKPYEEAIISYFEKNQIDAQQFDKVKVKDLVKPMIEHCDNNKKLMGSLTAFIKKTKKCDLNQINETDTDTKDDGTIETETDTEGLYAAYIDECPALHRVQIVLEDFEKKTADIQPGGTYPHQMNLYLSRYPFYTPVQFLNDIDHIIQHKLPNPPKCCNDGACIHIQRALRDRTDENCQNLERKKKFFNAKNEIEFVYISMLDRAHCLLKHSEAMSHRVDVKKSLKNDVVLSKNTAYNHGVYMEYHTLKPLYQNLFDEIICNKQNLAVTKEQFNTDLEASKLFIQTDLSDERRSCKTDDKYGIKINERIHIEHVLCIKFYCNCSILCEHFRKSYRAQTPQDSKEDIIQRHCNDHYWFGRFLTTAIEFWGNVPKTTDSFYHGLAGRFVFANFSTVYEIPTSTTWDINVAQQFCDGTNGIILKLSPKFTNEVDNSRCLDVSGLSDYEAEKEQLFAGMTVLSITNIYNPSENQWKGYKDWVASFLYFERIMEQTIHQKAHYNFGQLSKEKQKRYLVPLLKSQMKSNGYSDEDAKKEGTKIPEYIFQLFTFFCKSKKDYVDLSCIEDEILSMDKSMQFILFRDINIKCQAHDHTGVKLMNYKINKANLRYIFPNLRDYKNHLGYWEHVPTNSNQFV